MFSKAVIISLISLMCLGLVIIVFPLIFLILFEPAPRIIIPEVQNGTISPIPVFAAKSSGVYSLMTKLEDAETGSYIQTIGGSGRVLRGIKTLAPEEPLRPGQKMKFTVYLCLYPLKNVNLHCREFYYYFTVGDAYQLPSAKEQEVIDEIRNFGIPAYLKNFSPYKEFGVPLYLRNSSNDST